MRRMNWKIACVLASCAATLAAQAAEQPSVLVIELENDVLYRGNISDVTLLAKDTNPTNSANQTFLESVAIADIGKPFPTNLESDVHTVTSPLEVTVDGRPAELRNTIGWPGQINVYRVDFRVPDDTAAGMIRVWLSVAWISGPEVTIPVR